MQPCLRNAELATRCETFPLRRDNPHVHAQKAALEGILEYTNKNGVMTRPAWDLMHTLRMFKDCPRAPLPIAESLAQRIINIPSSAFIR